MNVLDVYRDVSRATSDRQRRINEAGAYRDRVLTEATGRSRAVRQAAEAARTRQLALAAAGADCFGALLEARRYAPSLTDFRLFWKAVADALTGRAKLVLDEEPGRRRHLVLPDGQGTLIGPSPLFPSLLRGGQGELSGPKTPQPDADGSRRIPSPPTRPEQGGERSGPISSDSAGQSSKG
jgi:hypothetical protein